MAAVAAGLDRVADAKGKAMLMEANGVARDRRVISFLAAPVEQVKLHDVLLLSDNNADPWAGEPEPSSCFWERPKCSLEGAPPNVNCTGCRSEDIAMFGVVRDGGELRLLP